MLRSLVGMCAIVWAGAAMAQEATAPAVAAMRPELRAIVEQYRTANHVPGTVFGVVQEGKLAIVEGLGTRDPATGAPVDADTRFRIASMSKAFTALAILKLRDEGKLSLDAPASRYVPEMKRWRLPSGDSRAISVRDLLHHTAGFVEDNPWGDRQQVLTEREFTTMIASGMDFASAPGVRMEYSNYGFALLGRIITNVSRRPYQDYIRERIMLPLGMTRTTFDIATSPPAERAMGYRWQDEGWVREPDMRDGAFGAMGGMETTANDYARWMAFLLSAWPAGDAPDTGPVRRSTVRDLVTLTSPMPPVDRAAELGPPCRQSVGYAMGLRVVGDCELGRVVTHSGGYPGYGSIMMFLPDAGVGAFIFNNRTYTSLTTASYKALLTLRRAGAIPDRPVPVSASLAQAYEVARNTWRTGSLAAAPLAGNVALDKDLARREAELGELRQLVGACGMNEPITAISAMEGKFEWSCATGRIVGRVQRAPTSRFELQVIDFGGGPND